MPGWIGSGPLGERGWCDAGPCILRSLLDSHRRAIGVRVDPEDAATLIGEIQASLEVVELDVEELQAALGRAKSKGVRGGRVHDYLHAVAAVKSKCDRVWTLNISDFEGLFDGLEILEP